MTYSEDSSVKLLLDKNDIIDILYQYCQSCDRLDETALRSCFHPDSQHDHGPYSGPTDQWIPAALGWLRGRVGVTHMVTNPLISIDGDRALSDCHFIAFNRLAKSDDLFEEVLVKGRYVDRFEKRDGAWKISHRIGIHDLEIMRDVAGPLPQPSGAFASGPMGADPYYRMLAEFSAGRRRGAHLNPPPGRPGP